MEKAKKTAKNTSKTIKNERGVQNKRKPRTTTAKKTVKAPAKKTDNLEAKVEQLKEEAKRKGLLDNILFSELLDEFAYQTQLLKRLRAEIDNGELLTSKTYIKSAPNMSPNKLIATYNATSNARVNTVSALAKLIKSFGESEDASQDPLAKIMGANT